MKNYLLVFISIVLMSSCISQKKVVYFQGQLPKLNDSTAQLKIYAGDMLLISVFTINTQAYPFLSPSPTQPFTDNRNPYEKGFVVSRNGDLDFPLVGKVNVKNLTLFDAADTIRNRYKFYITDPIVTVKKLNFKVSILGEVNRPGTYYIQGERATLPEALGLAGDLTQYSNRQTLKIIREENNLSQVLNVDLTNANSLSSEFYYLHPDDVIYVEPLRRRALLNINPSIALFSSLITTTLVVISFFVTKSN